MLSIRLVSAASLFYVLLLFLVAWYANRRQRQGRSIVSNPIVYTLSIAVYLTSWTFYGSVGRAATSGLDFILIYLGPSLAAFSWWFVLRKIVRISKGNNITSIADFLSSRYGNSLLLGALVAIIAIIGNMPYIALQLKAVSTTFHILCGETHIGLPFLNAEISLPPAFLSALLLSIFSVIFGARLLVASERHEGMVAAIALESLVKLFAFLTVGLFVTYTLFNGFTDIFGRMQTTHPELLDRLTSLGAPGELSFAHFFTVLYLSLGAIMLLPRQFHIMVIENSDEEHIKTAMWGFPAYMFLINLFVLPIALGGILLSGGTQGADYFVLTLPMQSGQKWLSLLAFLGGFSAAAGMVMVASVTLSTMFLNHLLMPILVRFKPRSWFPTLLVTLKRLSIFLIIFLGYFYHLKVGDTFMLVDIGLIAFTAVAQFGPSLIGGLYWQRGNRAGAVSGIVLGFLIWVYTLLIPSFIYSGWLSLDILHNGPFGIELLKPTELFGLSGFDIWTHALFWSMFFNVGAYLICSILLPQEEKEQEQAHKFVEVFTTEGNGVPWETKRLSKPITINQIANLLSKFIGEEQTKAALSSYLGSRRLNSHAGISEFELPRLKRFTERTLAASVGAAASGAIVESYLSDIGSRLEPVYDIFSTVRASLDESRENLYVRLRASEIMNRTLDLQIIMDDLLDLLMKEFKLDLGVVWLRNNEGKLVARSFRGSMGRSMAVFLSAPANSTPILNAAGGGVSVFVNDTSQAAPDLLDPVINQEGIKSYAHIPLARQGEEAVGVISFYSRSIVGLFTEQFLNLLTSLAGQLTQAVRIVNEMAARDQERLEKELAQVENARVLRDMELAKQIQLSLLPSTAPTLPGATFSAVCVQATLVGGDYYDFFPQSGDSLDLVIADVSGHSVGAALMMVETRSVLRAQVNGEVTPSLLLADLNRLLYEDLNRAELFISMFYARYDGVRHLLYYANAGHTRPLVFRNGANSCMQLDAEGLILGIQPEVDFEERQIELSPDDVVIFYTDGIIEAQNMQSELYGTERLCRIINQYSNLTPGEIMEQVLTDVRAFAHPLHLEDDVSIIVMKVR